MGSYTKTDVTIPGLRTHQVLISRRIERAIGVCSNPRAAFIMDLAVGATYELLALAVHCGQMAAGHYTTYKRLLRAGAAANAGYDDKYAWAQLNDGVGEVVEGGFAGVNAAACGPGASVAPQLRLNASTAALCLYVRTGVHAPSTAISEEALSWMHHDMLREFGWAGVGVGEGGDGQVPPAGGGEAGLGKWVDRAARAAPAAAAIVQSSRPRRGAS